MFNGRKLDARGILLQLDPTLKGPLKNYQGEQVVGPILHQTFDVGWFQIWNSSQMIWAVEKGRRSSDQIN